jgi:hypothetical protein
MSAFVCYALAVAVPEVAISLSAPAYRLPDGGHNWDYIGAFRLTDAKANAIVVRLYLCDSDSVAAKEADKNGMALMTYPNHFEMHAMYRSAAGEWQHKQLVSCGRVRFLRVKHRAPERVLLELRPNFRVSLKELERADKEGREINKPFTERLFVKDGVPFVER